MNNYFTICILSLLKLYSTCKFFLITNYTFCYENSLSFKNTFDSIKHFYYFIYKNVVSYRVEPTYDEWSCSCYLYLSEYDNKYYYNEKYSMIINHDFTSENERMIEDTAFEMENSKYIKEALNIIKYNENYYIETYKTPETVDISKIRFLSIEYINGEDRIEIVLPKETYVVGNKLFSPLFILRCLNYQTKLFTFDNNYVLKIMDNELKNIELRSDSYLLLEEKKYIIKNI